MTERSLDDYQALYRDFKQINEFITKTSGEVRVTDYPNDPGLFREKALELFERRKLIFDQCMEKVCLETCDAHGFLLLFPYNDKEKALKLIANAIRSYQNKSNLTYLFEKATLYKGEGLRLLSAENYYVYESKSFTFSINHSLSDMTEHLKVLANGGSISPKRKKSFR